MINLANLNKYFVIAQSLKKTLEQWDKKLDAFTKTYMDNPWAATLIFIVLLGFHLLIVEIQT